MYKVMIVDDEPGIRNGLRNIIHWEDMGLEIVCEASNGKEALANIRRYEPNIILTDIKMPEMDGIGLIGEIQKKYPSIKVAVLSGYDEFDYVRSAMRMGAVNYLLKPVDTEELITAFREILSIIDNDVQEFLKYREFLQLLQRNTLNRVITNQITLKELREKCEILNISFDSRVMYVSIIQLSILAQENWKVYAALNICDEIIHMPNDCYIFSDERNNVTLLFKNERDPERIRVLLQNCLEQIRNYLEVDSAASIGSKATSHRNLATSYTDAIKLLNYQLLYGLGKVFSSTDLELSPPDSPQQLQLEKIMSLIEKADREGAEQFIGSIFKDITAESHPTDPATIKYSIVNMISFVLYQLESTNISPIYLNCLKEKMYVRLQAVSYAEQLKELLLDFSMDIIRKLQETTQLNYSYTIKRAVDYIEERYNDYNISLKTLADSLNLNPAYLGRLFKQETGEYFSDYLNNKRIQKANELLKTSGLKANEIAIKVGFSSISYFYTVFKKITGQNPGDIRK